MRRRSEPPVWAYSLPRGPWRRHEKGSHLGKKMDVAMKDNDIYIYIVLYIYDITLYIIF